jgi:protoporphyrin/coproporphyrin ferrochelatase
MSSKEKIGVIFFNLGGPATLDEVRPFLYNLFCDIEIAQLPWKGLQKPLAWLISTFRYKKSSGYYAQIGGGSPLRKITEQQAEALKTELARRNIDVRVYIAMRHWHPSTEEAVEAMKSDGINRLVVLPLYPQFSISTTRGSTKHLFKVLGSHGGLRQMRRHYITHWEDQPRYIDSLVETIEAARKKLPDQNPQATHILFSAHSIPESNLSKGDPYLDQTKRTVDLIVKQLPAKHPFTLSFQSKVGPVKWLEPATDVTIRRLAGEGVRQLLIVPVSFVSEHIETLYELDILYKNVATEAGIPHYTRAEAVNLNPTFIGALADLVEERLIRVKAINSDREVAGGRR